MPHRILSLESRRASEIETLLRKFGAEPTVAPSMQEVPLEASPEVDRFGRALFDGEVDAIVFLTGVGAEALLARLELAYDRDEILSRLDRLKVFLRGPKPAAVLKRWGTHVDVRAPEPNTWNDLVEAIDAAGIPLDGLTVAVQEYGTANLDLHEALRTRGADVISVPVYRWQMPDDRGPLQQAARDLCDDRFDMLMVTSAQQLRHLIEAADGLGLRERLMIALARTPIASIGPTATLAMADYELTPAVEPAHPKMGPLAREAVAWLDRQSAPSGMTPE